MKTRRHAPGRPKLPDTLRRRNRVEIVLTDEERARLTLEAERLGVSVSDYIRGKVRA